MTNRSFTRAVLGIAGAALVLRVVLTLVAAKGIGGDPAYYTQQGKLIAHGHWFIDPYYLRALGVYDPSAAHPPLFTLFFAAVSRIGFESATAYRVAAACLGGAGVACVGFAARRVGGARAGVIAAVIAAIYPYLWSTDLLVLSETLVALIAALLLLVTYRYVDAPSVGRAVWVGVVIAAAALTRSESLLVLPLLAIPLVWRGSGGRERLVRLGAVTLATAIPLLPWVAYNLSRFDEPVFLSTNAGGTFADSYCDAVFYGPRVGWWENSCIIDAAGDESVRDRLSREHAFKYVTNHQSALPRVVAIRIGRVWEVFRPVHTARLDWFEGRGKYAGLWGLIAYLAIIPLAIAGGFVLRARRRPLLPFIAIVVTVTISAAIFYGAVRFRIPADVAFIVLAAVAIDAIVTAARTASMGSAEMRNR
jgi:4-amino-4-deoxy-L-arabinose transferase-like glycosyltransferase